MCTFAAGLALAGFMGLFGCQKRTYNAEVKAESNEPLNFHMEIEPKAGDSQSTTVKFSQSRENAPPVELAQRVLVGRLGPPDWAPFSIAMDESSQADPSKLLGSPFVQSEGEAFGYVSTSPWSCNEILEVVRGNQKPGPKFKNDEKCLVETHTKGSVTSHALSILPLPTDDEAESKGNPGEAVARVLKGWWLRDKLVSLAQTKLRNSAKLQSVSAGAPERPNMLVDKDRILGAMLAAHEHYKTSVKPEIKRACLNNLLTAESKWLDLQSHYWCQFPLETTRACFIKKVRDVRTEAQAKGTDPLSDEKAPKLAKRNALRGYYAEAYTHCRNEKVEGFEWIESNWKPEFVYIMHAVQSISDFNLESEQDVINTFYKRVGEDRPRRIVDSYPVWVPNQPRYAKILKFQLLLSEGWDLLVERPYQKSLAGKPEAVEGPIGSLWK